MRIIRVMLGCVAIACAGSALAQKPCSNAESSAAEKAIDRVVSWQNLQKTYTDYRHCDSGPVGDLFTDALMRMMIGWKNVDLVAAAMAKDADYKAWVEKHLMSPAAKDDREDLYALAKKSCPAKQEAFCTELAELLKPPKAQTLEPLKLEPLKSFEIK
jgi:hypothetical protein